MGSLLLSAGAAGKRLALPSSAKHTRQSVERVHADMERDRYFTGEEAVAYGLVDRVIERRELNGRGSGFGTG